MFGGVFTQLLKNICWSISKVLARWDGFPFSVFDIQSDTLSTFFLCFISFLHFLFLFHAGKSAGYFFISPLNQVGTPSTMTFSSSTTLSPIPPQKTHTMKFPWRPGGLTDPTLLHTHPSSLPPPPNTAISLPSSLTPPKKEEKTEEERAELMNMLQRDSGRRVNLRGGEGSLEI